MRKFSWILALILALSMAFVGCSSGGDDGGSGGGGGGGDATVTLPEGSITDITVDPALTGYWDGDDANGTLVFTISGVGTDSADTTKAGMILFALKTVANAGSTIEITDGKITSTFFGSTDDMYSYEIVDGVLTINAKQNGNTTVAFVGTLRSSSGGGGGGDSAPTALTVKVDGVAQQVTVIAGSNGTITYSANPSSYTYTYGTVDDSNYENAINRFKINLGSKKLSEFEKVTLTWTGISGDAATNKKLYLLASGTEANITPYKSKTQLTPYIASTLPGSAWHEGEAQNFNGTTATSGTLNIVAAEAQSALADLTGEVWFAIYMNASDGSYTIASIEFVLAE